MNTLIVYMSRHGTVKKMAGWLADKLGAENTTLVNLATDKMPDLAFFDTVIIGGSVYMGRVQKKIRKFCWVNHNLLLQKRIGLFLCLMSKGQGDKEFKAAFPEALREHAAANGLFGGEIIFDKLNFFEKLIVRKVSGIRESVSAIDTEAFDDFVKVFKRQAEIANAV